MKKEDETCKCKSEFPIVLQHQWAENAIVCSNCNLDRDVALTNDLAVKIEDWNKDYRRVYKVWLESDDPVEELTNPSSSLNRLGFQITGNLNIYFPAFYWWHVDEGKQYNNCPKCKNPLIEVQNEYSGKHKTCNRCRILVND